MKVFSASKRLLTFLTLFLCLLASSFAQGSLGGLTGTVSDSSEAGIPDVTLRVVNTQTGAVLTTVSGQSGSYVIQSLTPGTYRIEAEKAGFRKSLVENVLVQTATTGTVDIKLEIGNVAESVTVNSGNLDLQTTNAEIGTTVETRALLDLPISLGGAATTGASGRRQIENFIFLTPGVTGDQWSKSINGAPSFSTEVLIDGGDMQNIGAPGFIADSAPPYEAISEFKVQNTLYPAEYGLGYGIENFTMRSGTNGFHGDLFEFLRNDVFDARGFFTDSKPPLRQNEFGGTIGGPVILPHYNGKDKTHFFFAYSGFRLRGGLPTGNLATVPTLKERSGDFSDYPFPIFDPATTRSDGQGGFVRDPFPGNIIPANRLSPVAVRLAALIPAPDIAGTYFNNYVDRSSQPSNDDDWSAKIDHQLTQKQQITGAYWRVKSNITINGPLAGDLNPGFRVTPTYSSGLRLNHVYTISPTLLNHLSFGYTPINPTWTYWLTDPRKGNEILKIPGIPADANGFPEFFFDNPGYNFLGNAAENGFDPQKFTNTVINEDVSWVHGKQQFKFGFQYRYRSMKVRDQTNRGGQFFTTALATSQPNDPNYSSWGNAFASLLLGQIDSATRQQPAPLQLFSDQYYAWYMDDTIKLTKKFTVTLGLRYELPIYAQEKNGITSKFDPIRPNPGAGNLPGALIFLGTGEGRTGSRNIFGSYHKAFSPRLAMTYALDNKTVIRAGYGMFRLYPNYGMLNSGVFWNSGFGATLSVASTNSGITPAFNLDQGFPLAELSLPNVDPAQNNNGQVTYVNSDANRPARMQSWTLDVQRQLPFGMMLDVAYVGSRVTGLWAGQENINQVDPKYLSLGSTLRADINSPQAIAAGIKSPYPGFQGSVAQALRPFPQYTTILDFYQPTGFSNYHALQTRLQKNLSDGLSFLASYTLSKNIGIQGGDTFGSYSNPINTYNRKQDKALTSNDQTHVFVLSWIYELPIGRGKRYGQNMNSFLNAIIGNWQVNSIERYQSGTPISVSGGPNLPLFGGGNRPNWISNDVRSNVPMSSFDPAKDVYLNINAFARPDPFTFGNAPRRLPNVRTPAFYNEDFSVFKKFPLWSETSHLEFRWEVFNIFNRVVFGGPSTNFNNPGTFGHIGSQRNAPRIMQFGMKIVF